MSVVYPLYCSDVHADIKPRVELRKGLSYRGLFGKRDILDVITFSLHPHRVSFRGGGGAKGGVCPPLDPECPPLDFDFILPHSLVVDAAPP